jgi:hypothetical protein
VVKPNASKKPFVEVFGFEAASEDPSPEAALFI